MKRNHFVKIGELWASRVVIMGDLNEPVEDEELANRMLMKDLLYKYIR